MATRRGDLIWIGGISAGLFGFAIGLAAIFVLSRPVSQSAFETAAGAHDPVVTRQQARPYQAP